MAFAIATFVVGGFVAPRRKLNVSKPTRWASNLGLVVLNTVNLRITLPVGAIGMADFTLNTVMT